MQLKNLGRGVLFAVAFAIGLFVGEPISNAIGTQTIFGFTTSSIVQFTIGYFLGGAVTWIIPWEKR